MHSLSKAIWNLTELPAIIIHVFISFSDDSFRPWKTGIQLKTIKIHSRSVTFRSKKAELKLTLIVPLGLC